jgi:hypothetical protein
MVFRFKGPKIALAKLMLIMSHQRFARALGPEKNNLIANCGGAAGRAN